MYAERGGALEPIEKIVASVACEGQGTMSCDLRELGHLAYALMKIGRIGEQLRRDGTCRW